MSEQYANFASTTLNTSINNSTTTVIVDDGSVFPASGDFRIVIETEIMLCTSRSSNTLTVTRGQEGTSGASHTSGVAVKSPLTEGSLRKLISDNHLYGAAASRPSASQEGRLYLPSNEPVILRDTGSAWQPYGPVARLYNPNDQTWSWGRDYLSAGALVTKEFYQTLIRASVGVVGYDSRKMTAPAAPYKITALVSHIQSNHAFAQPAIGFRNAADDKVKLIRFYANNAGQSTVYYSTGSGWHETSTADVASHNVQPANKVWLQIEDDNTDHHFRYSFDGINFILINTNSRTSHMSAPDSVWWGSQLFGGGEMAGVNLLSWLIE